jgi:hypothetical protein
VSVDARRLWAMQSLALRRQRAAAGWMGWFGHPIARGLVGAVAGAAVIAAVVNAAGPAEARVWWTLAALVAAVLVVLGAPFRMFWRPDATLLARLPIAGDALYRVAARRSMLTAAGAFVALLGALAPLAPALGGVVPSLRLVFFAAALLVCAGLLAPLAATIAGTIVVSAKTQALISDLSSGQAAQGTVWLSVVPAVAGVALAFLGWRAAGAPAGGRELLAGAVVVAGLLHTLGLRLAKISLSAATREVAALDAVKLAHVERVEPRGLERAWGRLVAGAGVGLYEKDVTLLRRRHPGYYILTGAGILALWIVAFSVAEPARTHLTLGGVAALAAYIVLTARRLTLPPTEHPRLLAVLPLATATIARAKIANVAWRALWLAVVGGAPAVWRAGAPPSLAAAIAGVALGGAVIAAVVIRVRTARSIHEP